MTMDKQDLIAIAIANEIGISNANMAFDQAYDFATLEDAIASYWDNVQDSLSDEGLLTNESFAEAERAFDKRIAQLRTKMEG